MYIEIGYKYACSLLSQLFMPYTLSGFAGWAFYRGVNDASQFQVPLLTYLLSYDLT